MFEAIHSARDYLFAWFLRALLAAGRLLPYRRRVLWLGWIGGHLIAPLAGFRGIIRRNLALVCPELPEAERNRIARKVPENTARTLIEIFSGEDFLKVAAAAPLRGEEGLAAIAEARAAGRGVLLISGHFGNYDVPRAAFGQRGWPVGGLYRPMSNRFFNEDYVAAISRISGPVFPRGRRGLAEMVRFLRAGGMVGLLIDQRMKAGEPLKFFGHTAWTALSAAEMAVKYDALILPAYGVRTGPDRLDFELVIEPPLPHGDPAEMTQALNDSLERQVRARMDEWLWLHERWKPVRRKGEPRPPRSRPRRWWNRLRKKRRRSG